jgi:hypothetical protein
MKQFSQETRDAIETWRRTKTLCIYKKQEEKKGEKEIKSS